jgi:hypothetical protein
MVSFLSKYMELYGPFAFGIVSLVIITLLIVFVFRRAILPALKLVSETSASTATATQNLEECQRAAITVNNQLKDLAGRLERGIERLESRSRSHPHHKDKESPT